MSKQTAREILSSSMSPETGNESLLNNETKNSCGFITTQEVLWDCQDGVCTLKWKPEKGNRD
ncbi:MAG: hypothetical protein K8F91_00185 [Candidatus Obscuribacterales bacterium]|nr:hypothetical protein [Candidatus Obscuribacterales bacterium]